MKTSSTLLVRLDGELVFSKTDLRRRLAGFLFLLSCPAVMYGGAPNSPEEISPTQNTDVSTLVSTGCGYDAWTGSVRRTVRDIDVPAALGSHGLQLVRTYSSAGQYGGTWSWSFGWQILGRPFEVGGFLVSLPDGRQLHFEGPKSTQTGETAWRSARGTNERLFLNGKGGTAELWLEDGSVVHFQWIITDSGSDAHPVLEDAFVPQYFVDPYGQKTIITTEDYDAYSWPFHKRITQVTDPAGRTLTYTYGSGDPTTVTQVTASTGQWARYTSTFDTTYGRQLKQVDYSDGTSATYTYKLIPVKIDGCGTCNPPPPTTKNVPELATAVDTHAEGPMQAIMYDYRQDSNQRQAADDNDKFTGSLLAERHYPDGVLVSSYDRPNHKETRGDGPVRSFTFQPLNDNLHQLIKKSDFLNVSELFAYDVNNYLQEHTDRRGNPTTYTNEPILGRPTRITHPDGTHIDYAYTDNANPYYVATVTNERGKGTSFVRDPSTHRITQITHPDGGVEKFWYNAFGQVTKHQRVNGYYEHFLYDSRGLMTAQYNPMVNASPVPTDPRTLFTYYPTNSVWADRLLKKTYPANAQGLVASETYEYDRNSSNQPCAGRGLVTKITHADGTYRSFAYNAYGWKWWEADELGHPFWWGFDNYGRMISSHNSYGATGYTYNPSNGSSTSPYVVTSNTPDSITGPTGFLRKYDYDQNLRKITAVEAWGTAQQGITRFGYDANGNVTLVTDPLNHYTSTTYDSRDRKKTVTEAYGTSLARTTTYTYGDGINITQIDKPDNTSETKTYDPMDRLATDTVPQSAGVSLTTTIFYNDSGTVSQVTDGNSHWTKFFYDESDRKKQMYYYNAQTENWHYDNAGNLDNRTTVGGETQTFYYDNRNRKVKMTWSNNAEWSIYGYDDASNLTLAKNGSSALNTNVISTVTRKYDSANRLVLDEQNVSGLGVKDVNYEYDEEGKMTRLYVTPSVSGNYDYSFGYDARDRFETITHAGITWPYYQYYYDATSNETTRRNWANGVDQSYGPIDTLNRMTRRDLIDISGGTNLNAEGYTYDAMSRITRVDRSGNDDSVYTYYQDGELKSGTYVAPELSPVSYVWDKAGNRTSITDGGVNKPYMPNFLNQYTSAESGAVTNGSEHEIAAYSGVSYSYRNDEQLIQAQGGGKTYKMTYDALGRCVKRTLNNLFTCYIYDGEKPILEFDAGGNMVGFNLYGKGIDEIIQRGAYAADSSWQWYFLQQGHEGNVTHLTDPTGVVIEKYKYDAFGEPVFYNAAGAVISGSAYNNRFLFTGREWAPGNLGFYEYRARAYHPGLGRFMSEDPKGVDAGDYNLFRYCMNDPLDRADPMGLMDNQEHAPPPPPPPPPQLPPPPAQSKVIRDFTKPVLGSNIPLRIRYIESGNWNDRKINDHYSEGLESRTGNLGQTTPKGSVSTSGRNVDINLQVDWFVDSKYRNTDVVTRELEHVQDFRDFSKSFSDSLSSPNLSTKYLEGFPKSVESARFMSKMTYDWPPNSGKPHDLKAHPPQETLLPEYENTH